MSALTVTGTNKFLLTAASSTPTAAPRAYHVPINQAFALPVNEVPDAIPARRGVVVYCERAEELRARPQKDETFVKPPKLYTWIRHASFSR